MQSGFFDDYEVKNKRTNSWEEEWVGMPEYQNDEIDEIKYQMVFNFRNKEDYDSFHEKVKEILYGGKRVFDGAQRKYIKTAWYPHKENGSNWRYK